MAPTTNSRTTFGRLADRIRNFFFPLFRPNRPGSWRRHDEGSTPKYIIDLLTVDIPNASLTDETYWDALESQLEGTTTILETTEEISIGQPQAAGNLFEEPINNENHEKWFWDVVDKLEARGPFFTFASVQSPGNQNYLAEIFDQPPKFRLFGSLPAELRLKIWHLTVQPRLVHFNVLGAHRSILNIDRQVPTLLQVCHESRCEGLRLFEIDLKNTRPFFFNPQSDTLLWTRYPNCPKTINEDIARLLNSSTLRKVRHLAIVNHYWNRLLSDEDRKEAYTAIRKAPNLEVLTLVDDYFVRRQGPQGPTQKAYGMEMKLIEIPPEENGIRKVRWKKELQREGKDAVWKKWDAHLTDSEGLPRQVPEIGFGRAVLEKP